MQEKNSDAPGNISKFYTPVNYHFYTQGHNERPMVDKRL
jgi:hypothetical protein